MSFKELLSFAVKANINVIDTKIYPCAFKSGQGKVLCATNEFRKLGDMKVELIEV
jgi:hypothetical protein